MSEMTQDVSFDLATSQSQTQGVTENPFAYITPLIT